MKAQVTNTEIKVFNHPVFGNIRVTLINEEPHFCLADICKSLEIKNASDLKSRLNPKGVGIADTPTKGGIQPMTYVNEGGMYKATFSSRKPEAEKFQDWLCYDVVPSIRKTGGYIATKENDTPEMIMARGLQVALKTIEDNKRKIQLLHSKNEVIEQQNQEMRPKAEYFDNTLSSEDTMTTTQVAEDLGITANKLNKILHQLGVQYKVNNQWVLYSKYKGKGYTKSVTVSKIVNNEVKTFVSTVWTQKGRLFIHKLLEKQVA